MTTPRSFEIKLSESRELVFNQHPLDLVHRNRSQAFPDLINFHGRFYLAFRTAPSHFPSTKAHLQIFSSSDGSEWQVEHVMDHIHDVRDPHFLEYQDSLFMFFMSHTHGFRHHEPETISYIKHLPEGWTEPVELSIRKSGFWDIKASGERVLMSAYSRESEDGRKSQRQVRFLTSKDLQHWESVFTPPITRHTLGSYETSETSFDFDTEGNIVGTIRSLIYPNLNFAFSINEPDKWHITVDRFKCDGPRLFSHNGEYYLLARRSLFYRLRSEPYRVFPGFRNMLNLLRYSFSRKRTALYHFDSNRLQISHIADLPSHGDTGYSAVARLDDNRYLVVYYSSDIHSGSDLPWIQGQIGGTKLYSTLLTIN